MNRPTPQQLIANPSAYGLVRVSGAKLHRGVGTKAVQLTNKFSYFRPASDGDPKDVVQKLRDAFGDAQLRDWISGSQSLKVQQENGVRPALQVSGKSGEIPPRLKGSDEAGMTLMSATIVCGGTTSRSIVTVDRPVYLASDGTTVDSAEALAALNKALAKIERQERSRLLQQLEDTDTYDEDADYDDLDTTQLAELVRQATTDTETAK